MPEVKFIFIPGILYREAQIPGLINIQTYIHHDDNISALRADTKTFSIPRYQDNDFKKMELAMECFKPVVEDLKKMAAVQTKE